MKINNRAIQKNVKMSICPTTPKSRAEKRASCKDNMCIVLWCKAVWAIGHHKKFEMVRRICARWVPFDG